MSEQELKITGDGIKNRIYIEISGVAVAGFWVAVGLIGAASIISGAL